MFRVKVDNLSGVAFIKALRRSFLPAFESQFHLGQAFDPIVDLQESLIVRFAWRTFLLARPLKHFVNRWPRDAELLCERDYRPLSCPRQSPDLFADQWR